jgi:hypothetical protein
MLCFITLLLSIIALIIFNKLSVAKVSGKIPKLNISKNVTVYTKDYKKSKVVQNTLIIILCLTATIILNNFLTRKIFKNQFIRSVIILLLASAIIITAIVGIVYLQSINLRNVDSLDMKNMLFELNINIDNTNIIVINTMIYITYAFAIITGLICSGLNTLILTKNKKY